MGRGRCRGRSRLRVGVGVKVKVGFEDIVGVQSARGGCIRRKGASEAAPEAVRQAVGGGYQSGWGRLLSVTNAIEAGAWRQGRQWLGVGWAPYSHKHRRLRMAPASGHEGGGGMGRVWGRGGGP